MIDLIATLVPPRVHRHRYFGVLAPNLPLRISVTARALAATAALSAAIAENAAESVHRRVTSYAWALLLSRIYEVFPLVCPLCCGAIRIIAFITDGPTVREILVPLGEPVTPPTVAPTSGDNWRIDVQGNDESSWYLALDSLRRNRAAAIDFVKAILERTRRRSRSAPARSFYGDGSAPLHARYAEERSVLDRLTRRDNRLHDIHDTGHHIFHRYSHRDRTARQALHSPRDRPANPWAGHPAWLRRVNSG